MLMLLLRLAYPVIPSAGLCPKAVCGMTTEQLLAYLKAQENLSAFCRDTGLSYSTMHKFVRGQVKELKG